MTPACWLGLCLVAQSPVEPAAKVDVAAAYQEAKARAGHDPDALVRLALWCEQNGLTSERLKALSLAILYRPDHEAARGLLGLVNAGGKWKRPEDLLAAEGADPEARRIQQEYLARRARARTTADSQQELARWCEQNGLTEQAAVHYRQVVRLAPERGFAWKKLGYEKVGKGWARPDDLAAAKAEAEAQSQADRAWRPKLEKYREALSGKDASKRRSAEEALNSISDPRAVPMVWAVFVRKDAASQLRAADTLAQIQGTGASNALALLAVYSDFPEVRGRAAQILSRRDPREFVEPLMELVHKPFRIAADTDVVVGPASPDGSGGHVLAQGDDYNLLRIYRYDPSRILAAMPPRFFSPDMPFLGGLDPQQSGMALLLNPPFSGSAMNLQALAIRRDLEIAARMVAVQEGYNRMLGQVQEDVASMEQRNRQIREIDDRVLPILRAATGRDFGDDRDAWKGWWHDQEGRVYESSQAREKPTYTDYADYEGPLELVHTACFVAGTAVHTSRGPSAIESVQPGDRVLSQDVRTGRISYKPVIAVHRNAPSATLKLKLGDETVVATGIHRFWKPGSGWVMARDLKPGDLVRTLGGTCRLSSVEPGPTAPVFNLEVAENRDFFVGKAGYLVYDYSLVRPAVAPFDAAPAPLAAAR